MNDDSVLSYPKRYGNQDVRDFYSLLESSPLIAMSNGAMKLTLAAVAATAVTSLVYASAFSASSRSSRVTQPRGQWRKTAFQHAPGNFGGWLRMQRGGDSCCATCLGR